MADPTLRTLYHVTPAANLPAILKQGLVPAIGPRSADLGETAPGIYTFANLMDLDGADWLVDAFENDEALAVLELRVAPDAPQHPGAGFEVVLAAPVPATAMTVVCHDLDDPDAYARLMRGVWASDSATTPEVKRRAQP